MKKVIVLMSTILSIFISNTLLIYKDIKLVVNRNSNIKEVQEEVKQEKIDKVNTIIPKRVQSDEVQSNGVQNTNDKKAELKADLTVRSSDNGKKELVKDSKINIDNNYLSKKDDVSDNRTNLYTLSFDTEEYREAYGEYCKLKKIVVNTDNKMTYETLMDFFGRKPDDIGFIIDEQKTGGDLDKRLIWYFNGGYLIIAYNDDVNSTDKAEKHYDIEFGCTIDGIKVMGDFGCLAEDEKGLDQLSDVIQRILNNETFEDAPYYKTTKYKDETLPAISMIPKYEIITEKFKIGLNNINTDFDKSYLYAEIRNENGVVLILGITDDYRCNINYKFTMGMCNRLCLDKPVNLKDTERIIGKPDYIEEIEGKQVYCYKTGDYMLKIYEEKDGLCAEVTNKDQILYSKEIKK